MTRHGLFIVLFVLPLALHAKAATRIPRFSDKRVESKAARIEVQAAPPAVAVPASQNAHTVKHEIVQGAGNGDLQEPSYVNRPVVKDLQPLPDPVWFTVKVNSAIVLFVIVVVGFAALGVIYIVRLAQQERCECPICEHELNLVQKLGAGGFGEVYLARYANHDQARRRSGADSEISSDSEGTEASPELIAPAESTARATPSKSQKKTRLRPIPTKYQTHPRKGSDSDGNTPLKADQRSPAPRTASSPHHSHGGTKPLAADLEEQEAEADDEGSDKGEITAARHAARGGRIRKRAATRKAHTIVGTDGVLASVEGSNPSGTKQHMKPSLDTAAAAAAAAAAVTATTTTIAGGRHMRSDKSSSGNRYAVDEEDMLDEDQVVVKMIKATDLTDASLAQDEARELHRLRHPGIVRYVSDFLHSTPTGPAQHGGIWVCILMEHCDTDLRKLVETVRARGARIRERIALRVIGRVAQALEYCHGLGVAHRDIKSQNIFICRSGEHSVKLGDFGLARDSEGVTTLTTAGTDCYKSPEALLGTRRDARSDDMWSLGLVLHELLSNKFAWERSGSLGARVLGNESKALKEWLRVLPRDISVEGRRVLRQLVCKDPKQRLSSSALCRDRAVQMAMQRGRQSIATITTPAKGFASALADPPAWKDSMAAAPSPPSAVPTLAPSPPRLARSAHPLAERMESRRSLLAGLGGELVRSSRDAGVSAVETQVQSSLVPAVKPQTLIDQEPDELSCSSSGSESMRRAVVVAARTNWSHPGGAAQAAREEAAQLSARQEPSSPDSSSDSGAEQDTDAENPEEAVGDAASAIVAETLKTVDIEGGWRIAQGRRRRRGK